MAGEWTTLRLGDVCSKIGSGATPRGGKGVYLQEGSVALVRSQNVYNDAFYREGLVYLTEEHAAGLANVEVKEHDVLLNITGDSVARSCQVASDILPARVNQHVAIVRPDPSKLSARFLRYFLVSRDMQAELLALAGAGATRNALTKAMIENLEIEAPECIEEQRAIAHILGTLDDKIEVNRRMNETLEEMARSIFKSWFVDFDPVRAKSEGRAPGLPEHIADLFPDRFEDSEMGEIPAGWRVAALPEVIEVNPRRSLRKGDVAPYLDMKNMPTRSARALYVYEREFGSGVRFTDGDTLVARITPCLENGKTCFVDFLGAENIGWGSTEYIVMRPKTRLPDEFAYFLARTEMFRTYAISSMTGTSGRQRVPAASFDQLMIVVPPAKIANQFGVVARTVLRNMKALDEESRTLAALRDTLLPKLISGELRVSDAERLVEAKL